MKIFQPIVSGSFTTSGSVFLKGLTSAAQSNVILIDTASGQLYTTASSAIAPPATSPFPFTGTAQITGSLIVTNIFQLDQSLTDYATVNSTIVGNNNLYQIATGSYTAAFTKYTVSKGANARAGEFITVWNGTSVTYYDNSTTDIGNTSDITFLSSIVASEIQINAQAATSAWKIKTLATFI
jgi:hypothetical protein